MSRVVRIGMKYPPVAIGTAVPPYGHIIGMTVQRDDNGMGRTVVERKYFLQNEALDIAMLTDDVVRARAVASKRSETPENHSRITPTADSGEAEE